MRWIRRAAAALAGALLLTAAVLAWLGWRTLPATDGVLRLSGARGEIRIERDAHGIPTVIAQHPLDAYFGLGVVHAQDRAWQLETHRRIGSGTTAELFGAPAADTDRFLRALGVRQAAQAQLERAPQATREVLQAYADGIHAVIAQSGQGRAAEFLILGAEPGRWQPVDSYAWALMMAWDLGGNLGQELLRLRLAARMPKARIDELLPPYPGEPVPATADYVALYRSLGLDGQRVAALARPFDTAPAFGIEGVGSNNWVLAGRRTATGAPLLANDPHLKLTSPALWYLARLKAPGLDVAGATMPGLPFVVLGQNDRIAWGFTNTGPDVQDLYLEQLDPTDPQRVRTPGGWAPLESRTETLRVKGRPDETLVLRRSRHGPLLSDAGFGADVLGSQPRYALALRWTALDPDADPVSAGLALQRATSVDDFIASTRGFVAPMQNMVVADREGRIGFVAPGRIPVRGPGHDLRGRAPAPGWEARYDWVGFVPDEALPRQRDPASGWIASANQRIVEPDYPHHLGDDWGLPYRQQRIGQLLEAKPRHDRDGLLAMQLDTHSLAAARLLPWLQRAPSSHRLAAAARAQLQGFDGTMDAQRAGPLIFWAWQRQLARALFLDDAGTALWDRALAGRHFQDALEGVLARDDATWCDDRGTPAPETCAQQTGLALDRALDELAARFGDDPAQWRWGQAHRVRAEHRPFSHVPVLVKLFELSVPMGGDTHALVATRVVLRPDARTGDLYHSDHAASLRAVYDLADRRQSRAMHSSGQSGHVLSPHYRDFVGPWSRGEALPLWPEGPPAAVLRVQPAP